MPDAMPTVAWDIDVKSALSDAPKHLAIPWNRRDFG
jgi:hypothetical protein